MKTRSLEPVVGVFGLGTMGAMLARNFASRGHVVSVYNRSPERVDDVMQYNNGNLVAHKDIATFVESMAKGRIIVLMVTAGAAVDAALAELLPLLNKNDIIIDGGNSFYQDTERRCAELAKRGIHYLGCGISGGEEGALNGPSMMVGGSKDAWKKVKKLLESIAAKDRHGRPCVAHIGPGGAGHYVKMVHNGIEYGIMQLLAESYAVLRDGYALPPPAIAEIMEACNSGLRQGFLFETAISVLTTKDDKKKHGQLIDAILDVAGQKGTGMWTSNDALSRGIAVPTITESVYARYLSAAKPLRQRLAKKKKRVSVQTQDDMLETVANTLPDALLSAIVAAFAQGFHLIQQASSDQKWRINLSVVAGVWQEGCIIRMKLLELFVSDYAAKPDVHLFEQRRIQQLLNANDAALRFVANIFLAKGISAPAFFSAVSYIDAMHAGNSGANMIQGLRDAFGAHTYERTDRSGVFHSEWNK